MARTSGTWKPGKGPATKFAPGVSGNPAGRRPLIEDIHALAREHAPAAMQALVDALRDPERAIPAAVAILDRGYGKPPVAVFAAVTGNVFVGGVDSPPRETLSQWLDRRRRELAALDGPRQEHAPAESAQPPSSPNGEAPAQAEPPQAREAERRGAAGSAADSAGPSTRSMTPQEADWLAIRRRELGIEPDDPRPNPTLKR